MRFIAIFCFASVLFGPAYAADKNIFSAHAVTGEFKTTISCKYLLDLPQGYGQKGKKWPLVIYLHGSGERGNDLEKVKGNGWPILLEQSQKTKFILLAPQCPQNEVWTGKEESLISLLNYIESKYDVDKARVYLTGISMGGYGTWSIAADHPDRFAAIVPICGGGNPVIASFTLTKTPVWAFHGAKDDCIPVKCSKEMVQAVNTAGGKAKLTIYPEAKHDSWTQAYKEPALYEWLFSHHQ